VPVDAMVRLFRLQRGKVRPAARVKAGPPVHHPRATVQAPRTDDRTERAPPPRPMRWRPTYWQPYVGCTLDDVNPLEQNIEYFSFFIPTSAGGFALPISTYLPHYIPEVLLSIRSFPCKR
jgi:hypothetical protein